MLSANIIADLPLDLNLYDTFCNECCDDAFVSPLVTLDEGGASVLLPGFYLKKKEN